MPMVGGSLSNSFVRANMAHGSNTNPAVAPSRSASSAVTNLAGPRLIDALETARGDASPFFDVELASYTNEQWQKVVSAGEGDDRITLSKIASPVSALPLSPLQAKTIVHAPLDMVLAVFTRLDRNMEWLDAKKIKTFEIRENNNRDRWEMYHRLRGSFPVSDRDYYVESRLRVFPEQRVVESVAVGVAGRPTSDATRMKRLEVRWLFTALGPNTVEITHQNLSDPGGNIAMIPTSLLDRFTRDLPIDMLSAFRAHVLGASGYDSDRARVRSVWPELFARR